MEARPHAPVMFQEESIFCFRLLILSGFNFRAIPLNIRKLIIVEKQALVYLPQLGVSLRPLLMETRSSLIPKLQ